jgi:NADPH:quinone reductase-like Zn-dependent oxidoreductase
MPTNKAALIKQPKGYPLQIEAADYPTAQTGQIIVKNAALAINPLDWMLQTQGTALMYNWLKYPNVLGADLAGEVVAVGPNVTRLKVGDRVVGHATGTDKDRNDPRQGAFQLYTILDEQMSAQIPEGIGYERACVIPCAYTAAAAGLFEKDQLALELPSIDASKKGKTVLIWGGSTSVGCCAIQLAVGAGYEVFTTASPANFELVRKLGAAQVWDYRSSTVVRDIVKAMAEKDVAGALSIGDGAADACIEVLAQCKTGRKFVAMATYPQPPKDLTRFVVLRSAMSFVSWSIATSIKCWRKGVGWKFVFGTTIKESGVGKAVYVDYLDQALARGRFVPAPEPMVVGKGLEDLQKAMDMQKEGVSAKKIVVVL